MARTTLTKTTAPGHYATTGANVTFSAADTVNGNQFKSTGKELIIAKNTSGTTAYTVTVTSSNDPYGRKGDISLDSIPANGERVYGPFPTNGWIQTDGNIYIDASNVAIQFSVVVLP